MLHYRRVNDLVRLPDGRSVSVGALAAATTGEKPAPVILLHGFLGSGRNLISLATAWVAQSPGLEIALVDLPGHGLSADIPPGEDLAEVATEVLEAARDFAGGKPVSVVGHSLGGRVGLFMAGLAPALVQDLTLLDIAPGPITAASEVEHLLDVLIQAPDRSQDRRSMRTVLEAGGLSRPMADWLLMNMISDGSRGVRWRINREALALAHQRWSPEDLWPLVENPGSALSLCVRGGKSPFVSGKEKARLEAAAVKVVTLPSAGHFLHIDDQPGLLACLN